MNLCYKNNKMIAYISILFFSIFYYSIDGLCNQSVLIDYQGFLINEQMIPIDKTQKLSFVIFDTFGNITWNRTRYVEIKKGNFRIELGKVLPIDTNFFDDNHYIVVKNAHDPSLQMQLARKLTDGFMLHIGDRTISSNQLYSEKSQQVQSYINVYQQNSIINSQTKSNHSQLINNNFGHVFAKDNGSIISSNKGSLRCTNEPLPSHDNYIYSLRLLQWEGWRPVRIEKDNNDDNSTFEEIIQYEYTDNYVIERVDNISTNCELIADGIVDYTTTYAYDYQKDIIYRIKTDSRFLGVYEIVELSYDDSGYLDFKKSTHYQPEYTTEEKFVYNEDHSQAWSTIKNPQLPYIEHRAYYVFKEKNLITEQKVDMLYDGTIDITLNINYNTYGSKILESSIISTVNLTINEYQNTYQFNQNNTIDTSTLKFKSTTDGDSQEHPLVRSYFTWEFYNNSGVTNNNITSSQSEDDSHTFCFISSLF